MSSVPRTVPVIALALVLDTACRPTADASRCPEPAKPPPQTVTTETYVDWRAVWKSFDADAESISAAEAERRLCKGACRGDGPWPLYLQQADMSQLAVARREAGGIVVSGIVADVASGQCPSSLDDALLTTLADAVVVVEVERLSGTRISECSEDDEGGEEQEYGVECGSCTDTPVECLLILDRRTLDVLHESGVCTD